MAIGFWAIDPVRPGSFGNYGVAQASPPGARTRATSNGPAPRVWRRVSNLPGEFVFDVQSHHVDPEGMWRVNNPAIHAFFTAVWPQAHEGGEADPMENLSRYHYLKELYLDSATTCTVLSVRADLARTPTTPCRSPWRRRRSTSSTILPRSQRSVMHAFVMPNRGGLGDLAADPARCPAVLEEEMQLMDGAGEASTATSCAAGRRTAPGAACRTRAAGSSTPTPACASSSRSSISESYDKIPPVIATHKGFALPGFDQRAAAPRDVGPAAKANPGSTLSSTTRATTSATRSGPYRGDDKADSGTNTVDGLSSPCARTTTTPPRSARRASGSATSPTSTRSSARSGATSMNDPDQAAHLLGKLITHVGPKRIAWGTDSLWYGSPQPEIVGLRRFEFTDEGKELYGLPYGLEGDVNDPTRKAPKPERTIRNGILGRNVGRAYEINPDTKRDAIQLRRCQRAARGGLRSAQGQPT